MIDNTYKFTNMPLPEYFSIPYHNMIIGDCFFVDVSVVTENLHDYLINKGKVSGKVLVNHYHMIDGVKYYCYMCIDEIDYNSMTFKDRLVNMLRENDGHLLKSEIVTNFKGAFNKYKFEDILNDGVIKEFLERDGKQGRPKKHYYLPEVEKQEVGHVEPIAPIAQDTCTPPALNVWDMDINRNVEIKPKEPIHCDADKNYEGYFDLAIDNEEKEFIFNPKLTDDEFSKLSFDERTQWQLMNAEYRENK